MAFVRENTLSSGTLVLMPVGQSEPSPKKQSSSDGASAFHAGDLVQDLPPSENKRFYPALDGLRALAVLMVFYQHYLNLHAAFAWGWTGVDFFFVLSGFLITGILYDTRNTEYRFRNFYVRRTLRIFPLYYGVLLVALLLTPIFHWIWHPGWYLWPLYLGNYVRFIWLSDFVQNTLTLEHLRSARQFHTPFILLLGHFWSLCVEEQFYLVWPLIVFFVKDRVRLRNFCIAVCILSLAARVACLYLVPQPYLKAELLYRLTPLRADALLLGGLLALLLRGPEAQWLGRILRPALYLFIASFVVFEMVFRLSMHHVYYPDATTPGLSTIGFTLIDLFAGIIILFSLEPSSYAYRLFTLKPLRRLGQMSYGFYVFHDIPHFAYVFLVSRLFGHFRHDRFVIALVALVGTLVLSYLSFRFFEAPFLRLKDRFTV
jgi:peptidoglycan/LPS O-acetylase OafA/YrhL